MAKDKHIEQTSSAVAERVVPPSEQPLIPGTSSITRSIAHAVVIKDQDVFFLSDTDGCVPLECAHGFGLYYHDCRFLNGYDLRIDNQRPEQLVCNAETGFMAVIGLTNPDIRMGDGSYIYKHSIEIKWMRVVDGNQLALYDAISFSSLVFQPIDFSVSLTFLTSFEDMFVVRGMPQTSRGLIHPPVWRDDKLMFLYEGADRVYRSLAIHFSPAPSKMDGATAHFNVHLEPKQTRQILGSLFITESRNRNEAETITRPPLDLSKLKAALRRGHEEWLQEDTEIVTDSFILNRTMDRSMRDLSMLRSYIGTEEYFAAGVPWFAALFGRDSIITALQTLAFNPKIAEHTLRLLALFQGTKQDPWREEEPGRILHELRVGEVANLNETPHTPYYGSIDATPLFLILVGRHAQWTGSLAVFNDLRANIEAALEWIDRYGDKDRDGYAKYVGNPGKGLLNQGWKDSSDAIVNRDASLAIPPIALVEVQAYVYRAKLEIAGLYRRAKDLKRAQRLEREAEALREQFNRDFWLEDGFYALALEEGDRPVAVMSSNAGHALWCQIADAEKAAMVAGRLIADDMFSGWGIRTLSAKESYYNPLGYHVGTVWPHDNSLIVAGLRHYRFDEAAMKVFIGLIEAGIHFDAHRLPELFGGFPRGDYRVPVSYPVACQPQAWAAGAVPYMFKTMLGLVPEAFDNRLRIARPILPPFVNQVEIRRLRVGQASVDLRFERAEDSVAVKVLKASGPLGVIVEL